MVLLAKGTAQSLIVEMSRRPTGPAYNLGIADFLGACPLYIDVCPWVRLLFAEAPGLPLVGVVGYNSRRPAHV